MVSYGAASWRCSITGADPGPDVTARSVPRNPASPAPLQCSGGPAWTGGIASPNSGCLLGQRGQFALAVKFIRLMFATATRGATQDCLFRLLGAPRRKEVNAHVLLRSGFEGRCANKRHSGGYAQHATRQTASRHQAPRRSATTAIGAGAERQRVCGTGGPLVLDCPCVVSSPWFPGNQRRRLLGGFYRMAARSNRSG